MLRVIEDVSCRIQKSTSTRMPPPCQKIARRHTCISGRTCVDPVQDIQAGKHAFSETSCNELCFLQRWYGTCDLCQIWRSPTNSWTFSSSIIECCACARNAIHDADNRNRLSGCVWSVQMLAGPIVRLPITTRSLLGLKSVLSDSTEDATWN